MFSRSRLSGLLLASSIMWASCGEIDSRSEEQTASTDQSGGVELSTAALTNGAVVAFQAEKLTRAASSIGSKVTSEAAASGGQYVEFNGTANASGQYIEFTLPNIQAGTYGVKFLYKANTNRGVVQVTIDGTPQGSCNEYASAPAYQKVCDLGSKTFTAGNHAIRFTVSAKGTGNGYQETVDQISLTFKGECTAVSDCASGYAACVNNTCACRQPSRGNKVLNGGFDTSAALSSWVGALWSSSDADGCARSGSVTGHFTQCVRGVVGNALTYFGLTYKGGLTCVGTYYADTACTTPANTYDFLNPPIVETASWTKVTAMQTSPAGTASILVECMAFTTGEGLVDQVYLNQGSLTGF